jgi:hypothetical protein
MSRTLQGWVFAAAARPNLGLGVSVGVLTDYFRAPDAQTALRALDPSDGSLAPYPTFDRVEAKGIDPNVVLGQLVAFTRRVPWEPNIVGDVPVWPPRETRPTNEAEYNALPEDSRWKTGPWLTELGVPARDTLATVDDARLPDLAAQWAQIEEFGGFAETGELLEIMTDLVALARRARDAGEQLYCWTCL